MSSRTARTRLALAAILALVMGCGDAQAPGSDNPPRAAAVLASLIVSNPTASPGAAATSSGASGDAGIVYTSLPPGSVPDGERAVITTRRTGAQVTVALVEGGFDPAPLEATAGDTLDIRIDLAGSGVALRFIAVVPPRRPPIVVRTDPPPKKQDVPLNAVLLVVFSEPLDGTTVTDAAVQLTLDGAPVAGTLAFGDAEHLTVTFTPAEPLIPDADYTLLVTPAIADLDGDALEAPVAVEFATRIGIYLASADGSDHSWLVRGRRPAWSPDGRRIAFHRQGAIYVIDADGSNEVLLTDGTDPAWSPDGGSIVFADGTGISVMDLDASTIVQLIHRDFLAGVEPPTGVGRPAWSPDGGSIAFEHYGDDVIPVQIYVMNADGSAPRLLTSTPNAVYAESDPSWSADGTRVVFWSYGFGIAVVDPTTRRPSTVYQNLPAVAYGARPDFSPDGSMVVFAGFPDYSRAEGPAARSLYIVARSGGEPTLLIPDAYDGEWSPDGTRIAFVRGNP